MKSSEELRTARHKLDALWMDRKIDDSQYYRELESLIKENNLVRSPHRTMNDGRQIIRVFLPNGGVFVDYINRTVSDQQNKEKAND